MKILLFQDDKKIFEKSGIGRAMKHQKEALNLAKVSYTTDSKITNYDIVHINTITPKSYLLAKKAKKLGKKVVFHAHSTEEDFKNSFIFSNMLSSQFRNWLKKCYNSADLLLTPTPYSKKLIEKYQLRPNIISISNGINLKKFESNDVKVQQFYNYFKLDNNKKIVISVGHLFERKGVIDFIEVAKQLPNVTFIWFGYTANTLMTRSIKLAIQQKPDNVIFPGYIDGDVIQGAYASADMFFFPSYEETEGIVVLEALASKCQILVRNIEVYDSWLQEGVNCFMGEDNDEFVQKIKQYLSDELPSTIEKGFEVAQSRSLEIIGKKLKDIYEQLLETNS